MDKKIYDILPPKLANRVEDTVKFLVSDDNNKTKTKKRYRKGIHSRNKEKRLPLKEVLIGGGIILALFAVYLFTKLPKADIQISPKIDTMELREKIIANKAVNEINISKKVIPATYFEEEKSGSQEFNATGTASNDSKAAGTITIYNKLDPVAPFTLIKGTHFLSNSGKYFVINQKVAIPAARYQKGKLAPGSIDVAVEAKEAGEEYNIGDSKFSIPKLSGSIYYYSIYAESTSAMKGGRVGQVKKATKDDIEQAKDTLTKKLLSQTEDSLKSKFSSDDILLDNAILRNVIDSSSTVKPDAIIDKFNENAKVKVSALIFKKQDLEKFAKDYILSQLSDGKTFLDESLNIDYNSEAVDVRGGVATFDLKLSFKTYKDINTGDLIDFLSMKSAGEIKSTIDRMYNDNVSKIKVDFWPFWVNKAPKDKNRIKVKLLFE